MNRLRRGLAEFIRLILVPTIVLIGGQNALGQMIEMPNTPAGRIAKAYFEAFEADKAPWGSSGGWPVLIL